MSLYSLLSLSLHVGVYCLQEQTGSLCQNTVEKRVDEDCLLKLGVSSSAK